MFTVILFMLSEERKEFGCLSARAWVSSGVSIQLKTARQYQQQPVVHAVTDESAQERKKRSVKDTYYMAALTWNYQKDKFGLL